MKGALLLGMAVAGFWWWRSDPDVEKGNAKVVDGKFEEALADYQRAEATLTQEEQRHVLAFDRGVALHGANKLDEARKAFAAAAQSEEPVLRSRAAYNEGTIALAAKDSAGAIDAYIRSLRADPTYGPARHNLELILTQPDPPPSDGGENQGDGGGQDGGGSDAGNQGGSDGGGGGDGGSSSDGGAQDQPQPPTPAPQPLTQQQAQQLLDAMRDAEKSRPLGRIMLRDDRPRRSTKEW